MCFRRRVSVELFGGSTVGWEARERVRDGGDESFLIDFIDEFRIEDKIRGCVILNVFRVNITSLVVNVVLLVPHPQRSATLFLTPPPPTPKPPPHTGTLQRQLRLLRLRSPRFRVKIQHKIPIPHPIHPLPFRHSLPRHRHNLLSESVGEFGACGGI